MGTSAFDKRMKEYEAVSDIRLTRRTPVILRFDGCHFHTFTKKLKKPFDSILIKAMQNTMRDLCENIQGAVFGYTQSDEITIVLVDYAKLESDCWFNNRVSKMCSVGASMASRFFNSNFKKIAMREHCDGNLTDSEYFVYAEKFEKADFDCRAFNVPKEEVCNCVLWRQKDAEKNSIQSLAQSLYTPTEIKGISTKKLQDKMFTEKGVNWNDLSTPCRRGAACIKDEYGDWYIDNNMPKLTNNREYVDNLIYVGD